MVGCLGETQRRSSQFSAQLPIKIALLVCSHRSILSSLYPLFYKTNYLICIRYQWHITILVANYTLLCCVEYRISIDTYTVHQFLKHHGLIVYGKNFNGRGSGSHEHGIWHRCAMCRNDKISVQSPRSLRGKIHPFELCVFMANASWIFFKIDKFPITGAVFGRVPSFTHLLCGISLDEADGECVIF